MIQALIWAVENRDEDVMSQLLYAGCDIDLQNQHGNTALIHATIRGHDEIVRMLIKERANVHVQNNAKYTALTKAAEMGRDSIIRQLAAANAILDVPDRYGFTPVMNAIFHGEMSAVEVLVMAGADAFASSPAGSLASYGGVSTQRTIVRGLLKRQYLYDLKIAFDGADFVLPEIRSLILMYVEPDIPESVIQLVTKQTFDQRPIHVRFDEEQQNES